MIDPFYGEFLLVLHLFYDLRFILKLKIMDSGAQETDLSDLYHVKQVGDHGLVTKVDSLSASKVLKVP